MNTFTKYVYSLLLFIFCIGDLSVVRADYCDGAQRSCESISDADQCVNKQFGCTWFSGGGTDGCYGIATKCNALRSETDCKGHQYCSWVIELTSEKKVTYPTLEEAIEIVKMGMTIPMPKDPEAELKIDNKNVSGKIFKVTDIIAAKAVLSEHDIQLNNGKCCKKGAGPIPDRTDACYLWDNKFCHIVPTQGICSAASDACPSSVDTSALVPCDPKK